MRKELEQRIHQIHECAYHLCFNSFGKSLENAGNIGIFCQSEEEFESFTTERRLITKPSENPDQKYFELIQPIVFDANGELPEITYTHLYVRRYDPEESHIGDIDFCLSESDFQKLKQRLIAGDVISGARIYDRQDLDMVELYNDNNDVLAYVSTKSMAEHARVKQSEETKL